MPMETRWHTENRVIFVHAYGIVTKPEMEQYAVDKIALLQAAAQIHDEEIDCIMDASAAETFPPMYRMATTGLPLMRQKNRGVLVMITTNRALRAIVELAAHVFPTMTFKVRFVATMDQALEIVEPHQDAITQTV
jgi:hypothetical protein